MSASRKIDGPLRVAVGRQCLQSAVESGHWPANRVARGDGAWLNFFIIYEAVQQRNGRH
jgi:hypothetical protein